MFVGAQLQPRRTTFSRPVILSGFQPAKDLANARTTSIVRMDFHEEVKVPKFL